MLTTVGLRTAERCHLQPGSLTFPSPSDHPSEGQSEASNVWGGEQTGPVNGCVVHSYPWPVSQRPEKIMLIWKNVSGSPG